MVSFTEEEYEALMDEFDMSPDYVLYEGYLPDVVTKMMNEILRLRNNERYNR